MAGVCSWCWCKQTVSFVLFSLFFLILVDQVTVFVSVGVCAVAGAVSQVSFDFKQVPREWGINMHIFVFVSPASRSMWKASDVSIRPSQTKFGEAGSILAFRSGNLYFL